MLQAENGQISQDRCRGRPLQAVAAPVSGSGELVRAEHGSQPRAKARERDTTTLAKSLLNPQGDAYLNREEDWKPREHSRRVSLWTDTCVDKHKIPSSET